MTIGDINVYVIEQGLNTEKLVEVKGYFGKGKTTQEAFDDLKKKLRVEESKAWKEELEIGRKRRELGDLIHELWYLNPIFEVNFYPENNEI